MNQQTARGAGIAGVEDYGAAVVTNNSAISHVKQSVCFRSKVYKSTRLRPVQMRPNSIVLCLAQRCRKFMTVCVGQKTYKPRLIMCALGRWSMRPNGFTCWLLQYHVNWLGRVLLMLQVILLPWPVSHLTRSSQNSSPCPIQAQSCDISCLNTGCTVWAVTWCTWVRTSDVSSRQRLLYSQPIVVSCMVVPWHRRSKFGRLAFSVADSRTWNSSPDSLRGPTWSIDSFRSALKALYNGTRSA